MSMPLASDEPLCVRMLPCIDRAMRRYARRYPSLVDEFRSRAQLALVRAEPKALAHENPEGYMLVTLMNAFRYVERAYLRERRRSGSQSLDDIADASFAPPSFLPAPDLIAMAREAIEERNRPAPTPARRNIQPAEWALFRALVRENPAWNNRAIADAFNRKTGRKLNANSVWTHRRRLGI